MTNYVSVNIIFIYLHGNFKHVSHDFIDLQLTELTIEIDFETQ